MGGDIKYFCGSDDEDSYKQQFREKKIICWRGSNPDEYNEYISVMLERGWELTCKLNNVPTIWKMFDPENTSDFDVVIDSEDATILAFVKVRDESASSKVDGIEMVLNTQHHTATVFSNY